MTQPSATSPAAPGLAEILIISLCACLLYLGVFGADTLNPQIASWLLAGDPAQHYLGWYFFRNEGWSWPPGRTLGFGLPLGGSVAVTDSIPLLALALKPFAAWLPETFQYAGPWMLSCFILNGYFGLRLLAHVTSHPGLRLLGALFFVLSPPLFFRAHGHESLMAHWLLLAGIDTWLRGWSARRWAGWSLLAAWCHPYLLLMVLGLMAAAAVDALWVRRSHPLSRLLRDQAGIASLVLLALWLAGYLSGGGLAGEGYGYFSMNILALFNPLLASSRWLQQHDFHPHFMPYGQYEGFLYLGVGMIALLLMAIAVQLAAPPARLRPLLARYWPLIAAVLVFWLLALSNKIMLGQWHLVTIPLPESLLKLLATFRASGRLGWPLFYLLNLAILGVIIKGLPQRSALLVLALGLTLQVADLSVKYREFHDLYRQRMAWQSPLTSPAWEGLAASARRLIVLPPHPPMEQIYIPLAEFAARHRLATNASHLARSHSSDSVPYGQSQLQRLASGDRDADTLYLFPEASSLEQLPPQLRAHVQQLDGYHLLPAGPLASSP